MPASNRRWARPFPRRVLDTRAALPGVWYRSPHGPAGCVRPQAFGHPRESSSFCRKPLHRLPCPGCKALELFAQKATIFPMRAVRSSFPLPRFLPLLSNAYTPFIHLLYICFFHNAIFFSGCKQFCGHRVCGVHKNQHCTRPVTLTRLGPIFRNRVILTIPSAHR